MKRLAFLGFSLLLLLPSCRKDVNVLDISIIGDEPIIRVITSINGKVMDADGNAVVGAEVMAGTEFAMTDQDGQFNIAQAVVKENLAQIVIRKNGYFEQVMKVASTPDGLSYGEVTLFERGTPEIIQANTNVDLDMNGLSFKFKPGSIITNSGQPYAGNARVFNHYIDPTQEGFSERIGMGLEARSAIGEPLSLRPFAMMNLELEGENGEELFIDRNVGVELEFPIPTDLLDDLEDEIPSWGYDLEEEFWLIDVDCYPSTGNNYSCTVGGTGSWCCCIPVEGIQVAANVYNNDLTPAQFVKVELDDEYSYFIFGGYTNEQGFIRGLVPKSTPLDLQIEDLCDNVVYTDLDIGPYETHTMLPEIQLDETVEQFSIQISASLQDCTNNPISEGWINVRYPGFERNYSVDATGMLAGDLFFNCIDFPNVSIAGYDYLNEQKTDLFEHQQLSDFALGNIAACNEISSSATIEVNGDSRKLFPVSHETVWSNPNNLNVRCEIPGGILDIIIVNYNGVGNYACEGSITDMAGIAPDLSGMEGSLLQLTTIAVQNITSDGWIEATITGKLDDVPNSDISIPFVSRPQL